MTVQATRPKPGIVDSAGAAHLSNAWRRSQTCLHPKPNSEPSHLQAIHANRQGVIIKGMHHETFWEWRV